MKTGFRRAAVAAGLVRQATFGGRAAMDETRRQPMFGRINLIICLERFEEELTALYNCDIPKKWGSKLENALYALSKHCRLDPFAPRDIRHFV